MERLVVIEEGVYGVGSPERRLADAQSLWICGQES